MSTYSTSLKLELIGDGEQSGIWGQTTNTNLGTLVEQAITGVRTITMVDANYTLTNYNGASDESRNAVLIVNGVNTGVRDVIPPVVNKLYTVVNSTTGGYDIRIIGATGTGVTIPNGMTALVYCDGTNFVSGISGATTNFSVSGNVTATGNVTAVRGIFSGNVSTANLSSTNLTATTGTFSGDVSTANLSAAAGTFSGNVSTANLSATNVTATTFTGNGSGLTGTATGFTANTASNLITTNFSITESGGVLVFKYGATAIATLDSTGAFVALDDVTAYGSI